MTPMPLAAGLAAPGLAVAGLAAAMLPVLIHLILRRRRRPIEWAAMELLRQAIQQRRRQRRLERLLLLAIRMAAIALLGVALARPYLDGSEGGGGSRRIWIVLDDGIASRVEDPEGGTGLESIAARTASWIERRPVGDEVGVVLASRPPRVLIEPTADRRRVAERIASVPPSLSGTDLDGAIGVVATRLAASPAVRPLLLLASDFRAGSLAGPGSGSTPPPASGASAIAAIEDLERVALPPAETPVDNVQIISVSPGRPPAGGGLAPVAIELARQGSLGEATSRVSLRGRRLATAVERDIAWRTGERTTSANLLVAVPPIAPGEDSDLTIEVSIEPDAQPADDRRFGMLDGRARIRVGIAADDRELQGWFARALAPSSETPIDLVAIEPALLDGPSIRTLEALVVVRPDLVPETAWEAIGRMVDRGGVVIVAPPADGGGVEWLDRLAEIVPGNSWSFGAGAVEVPDGPGRRIDSVRPHPSWLGMVAAEFEELAEPVSIERRLDFGGEPPESEIVIRTRDGAPIVVAATAPGGGSLVLLGIALDLDWSDLPVRPLMVPLVQELLREGLVRGRAGTVATVGVVHDIRFVGAAAVETPTGTRLELSDGGLEGPIEEPGRHEVVDAIGDRLGGLVANIEAVSASTTPSDRAAVSTRLASSGDWSFVDDLDGNEGSTVAESGDATLSAWLLAGVIALLLAEALLARRFSHVPASVAAVSAAPSFLAAYGVGEGGRRSAGERS
jgi:hypothetical protein